MDRTFLLIGALAAFLGVALGAFGAHGLRARLSPESLEVFETGVRYQMYHAFAVLTWRSRSRASTGASYAPRDGFSPSAFFFSRAACMRSLSAGSEHSGRLHRLEDSRSLPDGLFLHGLRSRGSGAVLLCSNEPPIADDRAAQPRFHLSCKFLFGPRLNSVYHLQDAFSGVSCVPVEATNEAIRLRHRAAPPCGRRAPRRHGRHDLAVAARFSRMM